MTTVGIELFSEAGTHKGKNNRKYIFSDKPRFNIQIFLIKSLFVYSNHVDPYFTYSHVSNLFGLILKKRVKIMTCLITCLLS